MDRLHKINKTSRARKFDSYDFATLYTNIPHNALKNNIRSLVRETFKIRRAKYIIVRQTIGIPMGTDCAPQLANLFLFHYEYLYMKNLMRDNLCMAKQFSNTVRYIDDLLTLNNSNFEEEITNIYPSELTLKRTSESDTKLSYLDISISICSSK